MFTNDISKFVLLAQSGDEAACKTLHSQFVGMALATAMRITGNFQDAEDIVQDAFLSAFSKLDNLNDPQKFGGWLRTIVQRLSLNFVMRQRHAGTLDAELGLPEDASSPNPATEVIREETRQLVQQCVSLIPEHQQDAVECFYLAGQSLLETVETLERPVGTVKRQLHQARHAIGKHMAAYMHN